MATVSLVMAATRMLGRSRGVVVVVVVVVSWPFVLGAVQCRV